MIIDSISFLINILFRFSISSWFSLCRLYGSRNLSISSGFPVCFHTLLKAVFYHLLHFFDISSNVSSFISDLVHLHSLFFLVSLAKIVFVYLSKNQILVSFIFSIVFLVLISFISNLIFVISFILLTWASLLFFVYFLKV